MKRKRRILFPGIGQVADELGLTRQHLRLVLLRERGSPKRDMAINRLREIAAEREREVAS